MTSETNPGTRRSSSGTGPGSGRSGRRSALGSGPGVLGPVVLHHRDRHLVGLVPGDAGGDPADFPVREGRPAAVGVDPLQRGEDLLPGHPVVAHGAGQARQGVVPLAGRDQVAVPAGIAALGGRVRARGGPVAARPVEERHQPGRGLGEAVRPGVQLQGLGPPVRPPRHDRGRDDDVAPVRPGVDPGRDPPGRVPPGLPGRLAEEVVPARRAGSGRPGRGRDPGPCPGPRARGSPPRPRRRPGARRWRRPRWRPGAGPTRPRSGRDRSWRPGTRGG